MILEIEHDEWLYVLTTTPERAREFFGLPPDTEVKKEEDGYFAVRAPKEDIVLTYPQDLMA